MLRAVCFDLDGTLFDDRQYVRAGLLHAGDRLESIADIDLSTELLEAYFDRGIREGTFDIVLAEHDISQVHVPELVEAYHDNDADLTPFPGAAETLATLADDHDLALITGGHNGMGKLRRLGLNGYFDTVLVTSEEPYTKRDPRPFNTVLDALDATAGEAVYVGDRPGLDFFQPNQLGMGTIRVKTGQYADVDATGQVEPDVTIPTVRKLPELLTSQPTRSVGDGSPCWS